MTYDHWKTTNLADEELGPEPLTECDCCGEMKAGCINTTTYGMDVHACPMCCGEMEDNDSCADLGDWRYHQGRGA